MIDITRLLTHHLVRQLQGTWCRTFRDAPGQDLDVVTWVAELALQRIGGTDALYHDVEHTVMVTSVGAEILHCSELRGEAFSRSDWLQAIVALLCHDIGYVRGVCKGDRPGAWRTGAGQGTIDLPPAATDASLRAWHVDRGQVFVREQLADLPGLDLDTVSACIEYTRFPVPEGPAFAETGTLRGLCRAADLIGQLGDPAYLCKIPALYWELRETSAHDGFNSPNDMRLHYRTFFERRVQPWIGHAARLLGATARGRTWMANLDAHVFHSGHFGGAVREVADDPTVDD